MHPHLYTRVCNDAVLVTFAIHHLDDRPAQSVKERLTDLANSIGPKELRLDFEAMESMCSTALAMLVAINRKVAGNKGHLVLFNVADHLVEMFKLTRLDTILDIRPKRPQGADPVRALA